MESSTRVHGRCSIESKHEGAQHAKEVIPSVPLTSTAPRICPTVRDSSGKQLPKAVVQYYFIGGEKVPVQIPPHGNASQTIRPYYRTQPSTLKAIKQECKVKQPSEAYHHMLQVAGGVESSKSISEEPRNKDQLYNVRKQCAEPGVKSKDELLDLLEKLISHQADANGGFLREVVVS